MLTTIRDHLAFLYGESEAPALAAEIEHRIAVARRSVAETLPVPARPGPADCMLITYGDQISAPGEAPLQTLRKFLTERTSGLITAVHLLPFYPSSSDDGFSVMDYYAVDPALGEWSDITDLRRSFALMFDAVFNHASVQGDWFARFQRQEPGWESAFFAVEGDPDLSAVVRPRALPLLTEFPTASGPKRVWTTFSADQADLDLRDPRMLLRLVDVFLFYLGRGAAYVRLDAIAFLWKIPGTRSIHLEQTHRIIRLLRLAAERFAPGVQLITETNVPHADNISYFGDGANEAHQVYNFALPPLVFHTLRTGDASALARWASTLELPSEEATFFNFLASHDGIGLNPARGILADGEIQALVDTALAHGGFVSYKNNPDGSRSPYELNISYFDALSNPGAAETNELQAARFLAAHAILLALRGLPGIYFHSLFGSRGDRAAAETSGIPRRINRRKFRRAELETELDEPAGRRALVFRGISELLKARASHPAFSPFAGQVVHPSDPALLVIERVADTCVLTVVNVSASVRNFSCNHASWKPIAGADCVTGPGALTLPAYGVCWLTESR